MRDILSDIIVHTSGLKGIDFLKVTEKEENTVVESHNPDRSLIIQAETTAPIDGVSGVIGMGNLDRLGNYLSNPEFKKDGSINLITQERNSEVIPTHLEFSNANGDFKMKYAFMNKLYIQEKIKSASSKNKIDYVISFEPSMISINRLKLTKGALSDEEFVKVYTRKSESGTGYDLMFGFGDAGSHSGEFVFQANVRGHLERTYLWNIETMLRILSMHGESTINITDVGLMTIVMKTPVMKYSYLMTAKK